MCVKMCLKYSINCKKIIMSNLPSKKISNIFSNRKVERKILLIHRQ